MHVWLHYKIKLKGFEHTVHDGLARIKMPKPLSNLVQELTLGK